MVLAARPCVPGAEQAHPGSDTPLAPPGSGAGSLSVPVRVMQVGSDITLRLPAESCAATTTGTRVAPSSSRASNESSVAFDFVSRINTPSTGTSGSNGSPARRWLELQPCALCPASLLPGASSATARRP